jgi:hypothetical protein
VGIRQSHQIRRRIHSRVIVFGTVHDWGYFYVIGPQFRLIQTTYDYITNAIDWMPAFLVVVAVMVGSLPAITYFQS